MLGTRKPEVYGSSTLDYVERLCREEAHRLRLDLVFRQSTYEGQLIEWIHAEGARLRAGESIGAVCNPGAHTHTSVALRDAIEGVELPVIEVHISNVHAREQFRHHSHVSQVARVIVVGFGVVGYAWPSAGFPNWHSPRPAVRVAGGRSPGRLWRPPYARSRPDGWRKP